MKNFNTTLILIGILSGSILIVENVVLGQQAFVYISVTKTWVLCVVCIITGVMIGYGLKGKFTEGNSGESDDSYDF